MEKFSILKENFDIVFIATNFLDEDNQYFSGGAEIHLKNICDILKENKKILVLQMTKKSNDNIIEKDGFFVLSIYSKNKINFLLKIRTLLKKIKTKRIHVNYLGLEFLLKKKKDIIYSGTFHGIGWDFPTKNFPNIYIKNTIFLRIGSKIKKILMIMEQNHSLKKLDEILSVDTSLSRFCQQFLFDEKKKIATIYNFVDISNFKKVSTQKKKDKIIKILYPRNISFARGVHFLVPIAKNLKKNGIFFEIQIAGLGISEIGGNKYESILREELKKNKLEKNFKMFGRISHEKMPEVFASCDIVIIPTFFSEGTSLACLEAMASEKIVLVTDVGGLNDLVIDGFNGFVETTDIEKFSEKLLDICFKIEHLDYIKKNALRIVSDVFSYTEWRQKIIYFFNETNVIKK